jgi:hypothetical protein
VTRVVAALALAACGATAPVPASQPASRPTDAHAAADELRATVLDSYVQLSQGYEGVYLDGLRHDGRLILIDVAPDAILVGYDAQRPLTIRRVFPDADQEVVSKDLHVHLSDDGTAAWVDDALSYRAVVAGRRAILPQRSTAVYERREGHWIQAQGHVSYPVETAAAAAPEAAKLPSSIAGGVLAEDVRQLVVGLCADRGEARAAVAVDDDAVLIGPDTVLRGRAIAARPTPRALFGPSADVDPIALRIDANATQTVAWVAALLRVTDAGGARTARATWVVVKHGGALRVVQGHVSVPVDTVALGRGLFGADQGGAP